MFSLNLISLKTLRSLCLDFIIFLVPVAFLWVILPRVTQILLPFIFGYILYLAAKPLCIRLKKRLPPSLSSFVSLFLISLIVFLIFRFLFSHLLSELSSLGQNPEKLYSRTVPIIEGKLSWFTQSATFGEFFSSALDALRAQLMEIVAKISGKLIGIAKNIPKMLISFFATIFTSFCLLRDYESFHLALGRFFGKKVSRRFIEIKNSFFSVVFSYLKAQLIIGSIIFTLLFTGFLIIGVNYALITALLASLVDAVPILGTGTVLVPMSVFSFLSDNPSRGWGLLVLYGIAVLTRQLCEPKIIGDRLGIHPLLTIFAIYTGMQLFGIVGLVLGPIGAIILKKGLQKPISSVSQSEK